MNHAASLKIDILVWKKCVLFLGKHKKKQAALNAIAAHCVFKINASFYLFIFFIIHFFFSRLLQAPASEHLPDITKKFRICRRTFDYFEGEAVSTIFQTSPYPPATTKSKIFATLG